MYFKRLKEQFHQGLGFVWTYLGGLPALALMIAALGMGVYHTLSQGDWVENQEYFAGFINTPGAELPVGIEPLIPATQHMDSCVRFDYNTAGQLQRVVHLNSAGIRSVIPGSQVAEQELLYNEEGKLIAKINLDAYGMPVPDSAGVAQRRYRYNDKSLLVESSFHNAAGEAIVPRMPGYAHELIVYDEQSRPIEKTYFDALGEPIVNAAGESQIKYAYSEDGLAVSRCNYIGGVRANNRWDFATERILLSNGGLTQRTEWYDKEGQSVVNRALGAAAIQKDSGAQGAEIPHRSTLYLDEHNKLVGTVPRVICEHLQRHTPQGQIEWECFNAKDGLPCIHQLLGYAERLCEYGPDNSLKSEYLWDERGEAAPEYERHYTQLMNGEQLISLQADGSTQTEFVPHDTASTAKP